MSIPAIVHDPRYYRWALGEGVKDANTDVRDLAVSIIERSEIAPKDLFGAQRVLLDCMSSDENPYVRFRSAFALTNHRKGLTHGEIDGIVNTLREASMDNDVGGIAKAYLQKLESPKSKVR